MTQAASIRNATLQPYSPMNNWLIGTKENIPNDPPAETMPNARLRFSGATSRPMALNTTVNVVPLMASPTSIPRLRCRPVAVDVNAVRIRPAMYTRLDSSSMR